MRHSWLLLAVIVLALGCSEKRPEAKPGAVDTAADPSKIQMPALGGPGAGSGTTP